VRIQLHGGAQAQIVEVGRPAALLHVRVELDGERQLQGLRDGAQGARSSANEVRVSPGSMASTAAFSGVAIVGDFAHHLHARAEGQHLGALPTRSPPIADLAADLACESRLPARMLSELSTASTVTSPVRLEASTVCRT
jgi:hypothetical protein